MLLAAIDNRCRDMKMSEKKYENYNDL